MIRGRVGRLAGWQGEIQRTARSAVPTKEFSGQGDTGQERRHAVSSLSKQKGQPSGCPFEVMETALANDAGAATGDLLFHFLAGHHGGVARGSGGKGAVCGTVIDGLLGVIEFHEAED